MNQYGVEIHVEVELEQNLQSLLHAAAASALAIAQVEPPASLTILLTGDDTLRRLNLEYLGDDRPTDVLSFPAGDPMPGMDPYLGDVAISLPYAAAQAAAAGHSLAAELQLLAVHGVLHLLGHDHAAPEEKATMWAAQEAALVAIGAEIRLPAADRTVQES